MSKQKTQFQFIKEAKNKHPEYDYSRAIYENTKTKVLIICKKHGEFFISPHSLLSGSGCPKCSGHYVRTPEEFIKEVSSIFPNYDFSEIEYKDTHTKVKVICPNHGSFHTLPKTLLKGHGCPKCGYEKNAKNFSYTNEEFLKKALAIHPEYDYSKVKYKNSITKVSIGCSKHGFFSAIPANLIRNAAGCPKCAIEKNSNRSRMPIEEFIRKLTLIHPEYDYSRMIYENTITKVAIGCPKHGFFQAIPSNLLRGTECPKCAIEKNTAKKLKTTEKFIAEAKRIHPEYDYSKVVYKGNRTKITIICSKHGEFKTVPHDFLDGCGCPRCNESKGEKAINDWLTANNITFIRQKTFKDAVYVNQLKWDFYVPSKKLLIEYNGEQHYVFRPGFHRSLADFRIQLERDMKKRKYAQEHGYKQIEISYENYSILNKILQNIFISNHKDN